MTSPSICRGLSVSSWLLLVLVLLLAGAAATLWITARYEGVARFFGIAPVPIAAAPRALTLAGPGASPPAALPPGSAERMASLESRVARLETAAQQTAGSAGRADALLVAFAARRAVDRGVPLGYLEPLLVSRFGNSNRGAVAAVITGARTPVRLEQLIAEFEPLGRALQGHDPRESFWAGARRELGALISIRRADRPNPRPSATYERARSYLASGQVDLALAEAMRLPGSSQGSPWVAHARSYLAVHRALDEIESAALLPATR